MNNDTQIASVQAWGCSIPLPTPLSFGSFTVTSREYTAVRITTHGGLEGDCLSLTRRAPVDVAMLDVLGPILVGEDALDVAARLEDISRATRALDSHGIIGRARSLAEICMSDLRAQVAGWPLWRLLGGLPRSVPVLLGEGYSLPEESDEAFAERVAARVDEGFRALKLEAASYGEPAQVMRRLAAIRKLVGDDVQLVVDVAWRWQSSGEALAWLRDWASCGLAWVEDPLPREMVNEIARLRNTGGIPIAAGDEATNPNELRALLASDAVDILRLDAAAIGGIAATLELADLAARGGKRCSLHVHPEIHQHCVFAREAFDHIEAFPLDRPFDCAHELLTGSLMENVIDGSVTPPEEPGSGMRLNLEAVRRTAYRHGVVRDGSYH